MMQLPTVWTRLEKAAVDNGFDLEGAQIGEWRTFASSQTNLRLWLNSPSESLYIVAFSRWDIFEALADLGVPWKRPPPLGSVAARNVDDVASLHRLIRRAFQLSCALPDEPLRVFLKQVSSLPRTTEAERLIVQRVGQDVFRNGLIDYWQGTCAVTGLALAELLRASHIKPWADCETDAERLDVFNGFLLAPHLDAAFDRGFITIGDDGEVVVSDNLGAAARTVLNLRAPLRVSRLDDRHRAFLMWHRERIFRGAVD